MPPGRSGNPLYKIFIKCLTKFYITITEASYLFAKIKLSVTTILYFSFMKQGDTQCKTLNDGF